MTRLLNESGWVEPFSRIPLHRLDTLARIDTPGL